jgi:hypothetical protein
MKVESDRITDGIRKLEDQVFPNIALDDIKISPH